MKDLSFDLLVPLIFALVLLFQFVVARLRKRREQEGAPVEPAPELRQQTPETDWTWEVPPASEAAPIVIPPVAAPLNQYAESRDGSLTRGQRRFSREALLGNRRKLRDAVVIAVILGPCRAMVKLRDAVVIAVILGPCRAMEPHDLRR